MSRPASLGVQNGVVISERASSRESGGVYAWLREAPTAALQRVEDFAVELTQRHFEADHLRVHWRSTGSRRCSGPS